MGVRRPTGRPRRPAHLRDNGSNVFTNSAFLLFLRLPAGRAATVDYLQQLRSFDQPLLVEAKDGKRAEKYVPNPKVPPIPVGTEVALVRRASGRFSEHTHRDRPDGERPTAIYHEVPEMTAADRIRRAGHRHRSQQRAQAWQSFHEFQLSRSRLFAGRAGGLRAVGSDELDFHPPFNLTIVDEFENPKYRSPRPLGRSFSETSQGVIKQDCFACHSLPGVSSFNSHFNFRIHLHDSDTAARPFSLAEMPVSEVDRAAVKWKEGRADWTALRKLLAK